MVSEAGSKKKKKTKAALFCAAASVTAAAAAVGTPVVSAASPFSPSSHRSLNSQEAAAAAAAAISSLPRGGSGTKDNNDSKRNSSSDKKKKKRNRRRRSDTSSTTNKKEEEGEEDEGSSTSSTAGATESPTNEGKEKNRNSQQPSNNKKQAPPPEIDEILKEDDYYKILGLTKEEVAAKGGSKHASSLITKAYRRRCVLTHPDKTGGDRRAFDKVAEAYDVLSDDEKRLIYDRLGKRGLDGQQFGGRGAGQASFTDAQDLFKRFFGGVPGGGDEWARQRQSPRNRDLRYQLEVTLEDLYKGTTRTVEVEAPMDLWNRPRTARSPTSSKRVEVHIPRGALDGESVVLSGAMDFDSTETPGDLIFLVHQRSHPTFVRKGYDLAMNVRVSLKEALCGMERTVKHLDGRKIVIGSARKRHSPHTTATNDNDGPQPLFIKTGDVHVLKGEGMPKDEIGTSFGDLYIVYEVIMPQPRERSRSVGGANSVFTSEDRAELGRLLDKLEGGDASSPSRTAAKTQQKDSTKVVYLEKAASADFGRASGQPRHKHDTSHEYGPEVGQDFFGGGGDQFFFSSAGAAGGHGHPFFGFPGNEGHDENVQCRQM